MRNIERYKKRSGTKKQRKKLNAINKFQDEIAKIVFDKNLKKKKN